MCVCVREKEREREREGERELYKSYVLECHHYVECL